MPKRSNDFQRLVYLVRVNLAEGALVTESMMLVDRVTKRKREVDICVEGTVGGHPVLVSIECRDHRRVADVTWVDAMKAKHDRLPTNALILASRAGFTPEARAVASGYGIQTFDLADIETADFSALFGFGSSLWSKSVTITAAKVLITVTPTDLLSGETVAVMPDNLVYSSDGSELCQVVELVQMLLNSRGARYYLLNEGKVDHAWFEIIWEPPRDHLNNPLFLRKIDPVALREIRTLNIQGPCKFEITEFGMRAGLMGNIHVAWGKTGIFGRDAMVVATNSGGARKLSVNFTGKQT